jgi:hypothetical protein
MGDGHRDQRTLALAAGQAVWILIEAFERAIEADAIECGGQRAAIGFRGAPLNPGFGKLPADYEVGRECCERLLENEADISASDPA